MLIEFLTHSSEIMDSSHLISDDPHLVIRNSTIINALTTAFEMSFYEEENFKKIAGMNLELIRTVIVECKYHEKTLEIFNNFCILSKRLIKEKYGEEWSFTVSETLNHIYLALFCNNGSIN